MSDDRYEVTFFRGKRFDRYTVQALLTMEKHLGYELTVMQGSYNGHSVGASAGTHAGGGAVDLSGSDAKDKVRVGRQYGHFAMWERFAWQGDWPHHVHGILVGNVKAAPIAQRQVAAYKNHRDGLGSNRSDTSWHPSSITPYPYRTAPVVRLAVDLSNLRVDFFNVHSGGSNRPSARGKVIQRRLNAKLGGTNLLVDGVIGPKTAAKWSAWERSRGDKTPNTIPDKINLPPLLKGSIYYMVP